MTSCANMGSTRSANAEGRDHLAERPGFLRTGWQDPTLPRVGSRGFRATIRPALQIVDGIDDAAADLPVGRSRPIGAMLLERSTRQAKETPCFRSPEQAGRHGSAFKHRKSSAPSGVSATVRSENGMRLTYPGEGPAGKA